MGDAVGSLGTKSLREFDLLIVRVSRGFCDEAEEAGGVASCENFVKGLRTESPAGVPEAAGVPTLD